MASSLSFSGVFNVMKNTYGNNDERNERYDAEKILEDLEEQKKKENISFSDYDSSADSETFEIEQIGDVSRLSGFYPLSPEQDEVSDAQSDIADVEEEAALANEENEAGVGERPLPVVEAGGDENVEEAVIVPEKGSKSSKKRKKSLVVKHPMLDVCDCEDKCTGKIFHSVRKNIHAKYWDMSYAKQQDWIWGKMITAAPKRIRIRGETRKRRRNRATSYYLPKEGEDVKVCLTFFLSTLGYSSDSVIKALVAKMTPTKITPPPSKRGKHEPKHKLPQETKEEIRNHINKFNPAVSHYRREHAPLRKYLPPELSIREMYDDFNENGSGLIHYTTYQKIVQSMNIGFGKLGEEECETCEIYKLHIHDDEGTGPLPVIDLEKIAEKGMALPNEKCIQCKSWVEHIDRSNVARKLYREDAKKQVEEGDTIFSVDLEKVIMLPRMPGNKTAIFTRRIILFNETFAPVGGNAKAAGYIWHEGIRGRNDEDISSVYVKFLSSPRLEDKRSVTLWADNCTAQNKNWTLFSALVHYINQPNSLETLIIRFLEKGHTFMSADSFHASVEGAMRSKGKLYDFTDFVDVINKHGVAVEMAAEDFKQHRNELSKGRDTKYPHLCDVSEVCFRSNSTKMFWKESLLDIDYKQGEFVQKKFRKTISSNHEIKCQEGPRGCNTQKQKDIVKKLGPLLPHDKLKFWIDIPLQESSADLAANLK